MLPEIVLLAELENTLSRNPDFLVPDAEGLIVIQVHAGIQPVRVQSHHIGQKFPCPVDGFCFKIIPKREITQHLEEGAVTGCLSYILNVAGADTLLAGGNPVPGGNLLSCEIRLQWSHSGID